MGRPIKYKTADDLLDACQIHNDCYLWPESSSPMPMLGPLSPMAQKFGTVSVVRILFIICRYIPLGKRMVRKCNNPFCVNPFHFTESQKYVSARAKLPNPNGLFPQQEDVRHLLAPPEDELDKMRPVKQLHIKRLMDSAVLVGFDGSGVTNPQKYIPPRHRKPNYAETDKPVLVMKGLTERREATPAKPISDDDWDDLTSGFKAKPLPEVLNQVEDVDHDEPADDIFAAIRRRKEWEVTHKKGGV